MMKICELKKSPLEIKVNATGKKFWDKGKLWFGEKMNSNLQVNEARKPSIGNVCTAGRTLTSSQVKA